LNINIFYYHLIEDRI